MNYMEKEILVDNLIDEKQYKEAIKVLAGLIELTNFRIAKNKFNKNIVPNLYNIMELYRLTDSKLYEIMIDINYIYEIISDSEKIDENFVIELRNEYNELKKFIES